MFGVEAFPLSEDEIYIFVVDAYIDSLYFADIFPNGYQLLRDDTIESYSTFGF